MTAVTLVAMLEQQQQQERQNIEPPLDKVGIADGAHVAGEDDVIGLDDAKESCLQGQLECITHKVDDMLHASPKEGVDLPAGAISVLTVGALLEGDINIPGMPSAEDSDEQSTDRKEYSLEVLKEERDELGSWVLMGKHCAYDDEQMCELRVRQTEQGAVEVSYADGETHCSGSLDAAACSISGNVQQLLMGEEGFFVPSAQVTHTFRLTLKNESRHARQLRAQLKDARERRIKCLAAVFESALKNRYDLVVTPHACVWYDALMCVTTLICVDI